MHELVGSGKVQNLSAIQKYLHKLNIIKQEYLEYLKVVATIAGPTMDEKAKKDLMNTIWEIQFGGDKVDEIKETKKAYEDIKKQFRKIVTLGGEEILNTETNKLNTFQEWMN